MIELNAKNLKAELWKTLQGIQSGAIDAKTANAISGQARGIISIVNAEIAIQNSIESLGVELENFVAEKV